MIQTLFCMISIIHIFLGSKTVHRFPSPKFPLVYRAWLELIPSKFDKENFDYRKYRVCDRHFEPEAKAKYGAGSRLKRTSVPKLHLPVGKYMTL